MGTQHEQSPGEQEGGGRTDAHTRSLSSELLSFSSNPVTSLSFLPTFLEAGELAAAATALDPSSAAAAAPPFVCAPPNGAPVAVTLAVLILFLCLALGMVRYAVAMLKRRENRSESRKSWRRRFQVSHAFAASGGNYSGALPCPFSRSRRHYAIRCTYYRHPITAGTIPTELHPRVPTALRSIRLEAILRHGPRLNPTPAALLRQAQPRRALRGARGDHGEGGRVGQEETAVARAPR